jgi:multiple antibiotic resistance protein
VSFIRDLVLSFIPLFVAIDVMGLLPVFVGLTESMSLEERWKVSRVACLTAAIIAVLFILLGDALFRVLGVTTDDFRIAGGVLLIVFAIQDLFIPGKPRRAVSPTLAVVPIGMPLIVGPGVLTTSLLVVQKYGYSCTLVALAVNMAIVFIVLRSSDTIMRTVGPAIAVAAAKIASLFLAVIGVMMLREGVLRTIDAYLRTIPASGP